MQINVADRILLDKILQRKDKKRHFSREIYLGEVLKEILTRADEFVPSESGAILLDDPIPKWNPKEAGRLFFVACYGDGSDELIGTSLPNDVGIVGQTYKSGTPYLSRDVNKDKIFYADIDKKTHYESRSIISVPIKINLSVIGVLELINRREKINFDKKDLAILDIFARYTSMLIANALDAMRFEDLSKKDNLTGLYNDRYFYERLSMEVNDAIQNDKPLSMIFFDLDRFKDVNDTYGHLSGSRVLKEVAQLVEEVLIGHTSVSARYGGDEYVILLPGTKTKKASEIAEKVRARIAENTFIKEGTSAGDPPRNISGLITCSLGVATLSSPFPVCQTQREIEEKLLKAADYAMYRSKDLGKNRVTVVKDLKKIDENRRSDKEFKGLSIA